MANTDERYLRVRRNSMIFAGLLTLSIFVGFSEADNASTFLPFKLQKPEFIPHILLIIVLFHIYDCAVNWISQEKNLREIEVRKYDFFVINIFLLGSVSSYLWYFLFRDIVVFRLNVYVTTIFGVFVSIILGVITTFVTVAYARRKYSAEQKFQQSIEQKLLRGDWILHYNPNDPKGKKQIGFSVDGTIKNSNKNEKYWRVRGENLEILNENMVLFSQFYYDPKKLSFIHTNDPDTLSLRDQLIRRSDIEKLQESVQ